ncbi:YHS domain-containing (seleno)protein [Ruegeria sp.]|uniref:YHS domain-containing (seleno)protein n=1 Tax=Ruegeria sp. TaxID=1879320 RepID=UPI002320F7D5|nr:YHS domain-containing (seleno)protein [Ruegeria sp.]MDA7965093.1 YHS domain protein [Ruegeria sp.]
MLSRRTFLTALTCSAMAPMAQAQAQPLFYAASGAAVSGYDAVSYFRTSGPVPGRPEIALMWKGATWRFASEENRNRFESNPRAFAPQYGGYCAYAMAKNKLLSSDPQAWRIVDGHLYLTHSRKIELIWQQNVGKYIRQADKNWPDILYQS